MASSFPPRILPQLMPVLIHCWDDWEERETAIAEPSLSDRATPPLCSISSAKVHFCEVDEVSSEITDSSDEKYCGN